VPDIGGAVRALKGHLGLQNDVNIPLSSSAVAAQKTLRPSDSPAAQEMAAREIVADLQKPEQKQTTVEEQLALKDRALEDARLRTEGLQANVSSLTEKMQQFMDALAKPQATPQGKPQEMELPKIPEDISERPADEQLRIITSAYTELQGKVKAEFNGRDENLKKFLGPLAHEVFEMKKLKDRQSVSEQFPKFNWKKHQEAFEKKLFTMPGLSPLEAARLVADPTELAPTEPEADMSDRTLPSVAASSGRSAQVPAETHEADGDYSRRLTGAIRDAQMRGSTRTAGDLFKQLLRHKLPKVTQKG